MSDLDLPQSSAGIHRDTRQTSEVRPSTVKLPAKPPHGERTIFDFFLQRFPRVPREAWIERFAAGRVWAKSRPIDATSPYEPLLQVHYRREVECEPPVRTDFRVVWSDRHLMIVDKPPNLPVTPGGLWVRHCLLHLLAEATGNDTIAPLHRLDRLTSGLVLVSLDPSTRSHYSRLFQPGSPVEKTYTAVCELRRERPPRTFTLDHHIVRSPEEYWRQIVAPGRPANAHCEVEVVTIADGLVLARVRPKTGRKHQIRVQLAHEGLPILGDPLYGTKPSYDPADLTQRLWLDSHRLAAGRFPGRDHASELIGNWTSSRTPTEFFARARGISSGNRAAHPISAW